MGLVCSLYAQDSAPWQAACGTWDSRTTILASLLPAKGLLTSPSLSFSIRKIDVDILQTQEATCVWPLATAGIQHTLSCSSFPHPVAQALHYTGWIHDGCLINADLPISGDEL